MVAIMNLLFWCSTLCLVATAAAACNSGSNHGSDAGDDVNSVGGEQDSDGGSGAIVDEASLRWQLVNPNVSFQSHSPTDSSPAKFEVSCAIGEGRIDFIIEAPRVNDKPSSSLRVRRANPSQKTCIVEMREAPTVGDAIFMLADTCTGTYERGGCVLEGAFDSDGWDFAGTLTCTALVQQPGDPAFSLVDSAATNGPVVIKLDQCER